MVENPKKALIEKTVTTVAEEAGGAAVQSMKASALLQQKVSDFKFRHVVYSDDIATACAVVDILYSSVLQIRIRDVPLSEARADDRSVPATFLVGRLLGDIRPVKSEDESLHRTVQRLKDARSAFADVFPLCVAAITGKEYLDLREWGKSLTTLIAADVSLIKEAMQTCKNGVEACEKGFSLASVYDKDIGVWLAGEAHAT